MIDVDKTIGTAVKTGKVTFGINNTVKNIKLGRGKLVVVASNCPKNVIDDIKYYIKLSEIPLIIYKGTSIDLGAVCGKRFNVLALIVRELGDSDIQLSEEVKTT